MAKTIHCNCKDVFTELQLLESGIHLPCEIGVCVQLAGRKMSTGDDSTISVVLSEEDDASNFSQRSSPVQKQLENNESSPSTSSASSSSPPPPPPSSPLHTTRPCSMIITSHMVLPVIKRLTKKFCKCFNLLYVNRFQCLPEIIMHVVIEGYITKNYKERKLLKKMKKGGAIFVKSAWIRESLLHGVIKSPVQYYIDDVDKMLAQVNAYDSSSD